MAKTQSPKTRTGKSPSPGASLKELWPVLGDTSRLRLLALLQREELSVAELQQILHLSQPTISNHLATLRKTALVHSRREGQRIYYTLHPALSEATSQIVQTALLMLQETDEAGADEAALREVLAKRRDAATEYFNRMAGRLDRARCPGRSWGAVGPLLSHLVPEKVIADLGAGEGWLSQLLCRRAKQVIAIDNSPKMVEYAMAEVRAKAIPNLEYRLGDIAAPPIDPESVDIAIMSQALHHTANPAEAIRAAARILKPGGLFLILDLSQHHFDEARELYGDYWLGFNETDLRIWLKKAGFNDIAVQVLDPDPDPPGLRPLLASARK
ncbi:metalloregulator ArsR/SmtB family transcription factor [Verrucomicrobium sp. GAS474]|uniref:ArsR/SmtB family transcription factor n=1 Tax=Verrucomicrobium sp. GAS474 TaxID=1882831 RepID=UPI000B860834|nr:metalloregulator ArsR/SmtB family transcription factor [Verrucomicrobium sp. GAS474]